MARELTVKGVPNLDSLPKVASGKLAPISEIAMLSEDIPEKKTKMLIMF